MLNRPFNAVLVRLAIVASALALLMLVAPAASAGSHLAVDYAENGTDPVATFNATDADGDAIVWGLDGDDEGAFEIPDGVLSFKDSPNFEAPTDDRADNVYKVTVTATGGTQAVEVTVTNVDEPGAPTLTKPQPQVGRGLEAEGPKDPDVPITDVRWQWARSMDKETWEDIGDPSASGSRSPTTDDEGYYLRATATYTDSFGSGKTASVMSENAVEERTVANARPSFSDHEDSDTDTAGLQIARDVDEGIKGAQVGKPITAKDDDTALLYSLTLADDPGTTDVDESKLFGINSRTAQITTSAELNSDDDSDATTDATYTVTVTATDPSTASQTVTVVITVNDVNDAPSFADAATKTLWVNENEETKTLRTSDEVTGTEVGAYTATDDDTADTTLTYSLGGADEGSFALSDAGVLTVDADHAPNYETKKSYSVTLMVEDDEFALGTLDVTVNVRNADDPGEVSFNVRGPQVGRSILATLDAEDGTVRGQSWQWYRNAASDTADSALASATTPCEDDTATLCLIPDATSPSYTPSADDVNDTAGSGRLAARVTYTDAVFNGTDADDTATGDQDSASMVTQADVQESNAANTAPKFNDDQDPNTPGDQADAEREVPENEKGFAVGDPVIADDADSGDLLIYSLSGPDAASFTIDSGLKASDSEGQIKTAVELDFETRTDYMVVVMAMDPSGATDTINVNITVADGPDNAVITGVKTFTYAENGTDPVATFSATDQDGDAIVWGLDGDDEGAFEIPDGVLSFKDSPNFEAPTDDRADNVYKVTVTATGGTLAVEVTVTNVDEPGAPTLTKPQPQVGRGLEAEGPKDPDVPITDVRWQWARSMDKETWEDIGDPSASGSRSPTTDDEGYYLRATATYTDSFGSGKTASVVSENAVEDRTLANARPSFSDHEDSDTDTAGLQIARDVDEGIKGAQVGKPITAKDDDTALLYSLTLADDPGTTDVDESKLFGINSRTAQITTSEELNSNDGTGDPVTYTVTVTATDPSTASQTVTVVITVNDVNDAPSFADAATKTLWVNENEETKTLRTSDEVTGTEVGAYTATDDDTADTTLTYSLGGADEGSFALSDAGVLTVDADHAPNYETKKSYSVTLMVEDDEFALGTLDVTVNVRNADDPGEVSFNVRGPQVGRSILATLDAEDGTVRGQSWQWYRNAASDTADSALASATTPCETIPLPCA